MPASVDASDVDFSDRLNVKRKSYKASSRRQRVLEDGTEELGDLSDEDEAENLARKIARLKREIEEAKEEYGRQKAASDEAKAATQATATTDREIESLSKTLDEIARLDESLVPRTVTRTVTRVVSDTSGEKQAPLEQHTEGFASYTVTYAPTYEQTHALAKAADFDRRLAMLEKALGVGSSAMPEFDSNGLPRAIIPTLETLHKQVTTLSEAPSSVMDTVTRKVRELTQDAEELEKARRKAKEEDGSGDDSEQIAKINALYSTIPTIESLTPLLPPLLDRLRSLRMIHADAGSAAETLERIEQKQAEMAGDIQQWREGLEKVEAALKNSEGSMAKNMEVTAGWIKELEAKMAKLS